MDFDKIKDAINSIEMTDTMKNRIMENSKSRQKENSKNLNFKRWMSVACVFAIVLLIIRELPFINKSGDLQVANFAITAYALGDDSNQPKTNLSSEKATFELSTEERVGVIESTGGDGYGTIFTNIVLNVTGKDIDSITYTINKGRFVEDVILTVEERRDRDWILSEKIYIITGEPGSDIHQGIKEIGNTYTVMYNEQEKYEYTLAIPHDGNYIIDDDILIKVNVKYTDGKTVEEDIILIQESDSILLKLK